jgi:GNAT superfamily N-acetyltransferase
MNRSHLHRKIITDKNGHRKTVWVKNDVSKKSKSKGIKFEEAKHPMHNQPIKTTRIFKDKDGTEHMIYLRSTDGGYLINTVVKKNLRFQDRTDRYGNKGYYIGAEQGKDGTSGFLFLSKKKGQDYYTADAGRADALFTMEKYRRKGVATAMHKFAEDVLKLKVKPSDTLSSDAKGFYNKEFRDWFKGSKVVTKDGKPLIVYHGSREEITEWYDGSYFTDDYYNAEGYASGEYVYEGYISLKKPLIIDAKGKKWDEIDTPYGTSTQEVVGNLDTKKYDGIIFNNIKDSWIDDEEAQDPATIYWVAKASQMMPTTANKELKD